MPPAVRTAVVLCIVFAAAAPGTADGPPVEIAVYAAASLRDALQAIAPTCEREAGIRLIHNFGSSNDLARQIVAANKADVFFSADEAWMDHVAGAGLVDSSSLKALLSNRLAVIIPEDSNIPIRSIEDLAQAGVRRVALANPAAVPAGRYAKAWLEMEGIWEKIAPKVVPTPDVRAALVTVESGAVDAGIVYRTDAAMARRARVAFVAAADDGPRITYPIAALRDRPHLDAARRAIACYAGPEARELFERAGFIVLEPGAADAAASR